MIEISKYFEDINNWRKSNMMLNGYKSMLEYSSVTAELKLIFVQLFCIKNIR